VARGTQVRRIVGIESVVRRKLRQLEIDGRSGQNSVCINDQYRPADDLAKIRPWSGSAA
jgi:hypothetical protein